MKAEFPLIAFTADTVSRLTGLSTRQLHHWDRTGFVVPSFADPQRRRPYSRIYSFVDIVALRTISELRQRGVPFPELKKVRAFFGTRTNEGWATRRFYVLGQRVFFTHEDAVLAAKPLGQRVEQDILDLGPIVNDIEMAIRQLPTRAAEEIGRIDRDRFIMNGVPLIAGTRIPTSTVAWFAHHGYSFADIKREFPRLTSTDIQAALDHEHTLDDERRSVVEAVG